MDAPAAETPPAPPKEAAPPSGIYAAAGRRTKCAAAIDDEEEATDAEPACHLWFSDRFSASTIEAKEQMHEPANRGESIGIRVGLPFEQEVNPFVVQAFEHESFSHGCTSSS